MKAVRVHRYGEDPQIDEVPEPEITGPWDVIVDVGAAGLCRTDLHVIEGQWDAIQHPRLPYILGHESLKALTAANITVIDTSEAALELAGALGADTVLRSPDTAAVLEATGGGAHVVFDFVGEHGTEAQGVAMLRNRGSYYSIGYGGEIRIPTIELISREISVVGNLVGTYQDLVELMTLTAAGDITLHTTAYDLEDAVQAMHDLDAGKLTGRGILIPPAAGRTS